ncbi:MAG: 4Fe-4S binding protein [Bacteroides sp.]|nr:4Fe-4S binding protein [Prevotella sp.]MCM1407918.1 4Fe-4S binding protein [Treponema brennaborense]MCM1469660.1 4Fe-4S binding protein [Bacteroides sp.]
MIRYFIYYSLLIIGSGTLIAFIFFGLEAILHITVSAGAVIPEERKNTAPQPSAKPKDPARKYRAVVHCSPDKKFNSVRFNYTGFKDCRLFKFIYNSGTDCESGCIGFGSCAAACKNRAIQIVRGTAVIADSCDGCGKCIPLCPNNLISLIPYEADYYIRCKTENGKDTSCSDSCDGCGKCAPTGFPSAVRIAGGCAVINYDDSLKVSRQQAQSCRKHVIKNVSQEQ